VTRARPSTSFLKLTFKILNSLSLSLSLSLSTSNKNKKKSLFLLSGLSLFLRKIFFALSSLFVSLYIFFCVFFFFVTADEDSLPPARLQATTWGDRPTQRNTNRERERERERERRSGRLTLAGCQSLSTTGTLSLSLSLPLWC